MIKILSYKEIDVIEWQGLSENSPTASFFQTKECYDFYYSLSFMTPFVYAVVENDKLKGLICGYIIANGGALKRYFSRRAIVHGGPLLAEDISPGELTFLLEHVKKELSKKTIYIEFRNNNNYSEYKPYFEEKGFQYQPYLNYIVDTGSGNLTSLKISKSKRRQNRKAIEAGVQIIETTNKNDVGDFYAILENLYREKVKKPFFPVEFFEKLVSLPSGRLFVVKYNGKVISGMACVFFAQKAVYEWFVCGDNKEYGHIYPSVAVTYAAIAYAVESGFSTFDFMGAGKSGENYGVRKFKQKFGGKLVEYGRYVCINNKTQYFIGRNIIKRINITNFIS
jgi:hypothetical protein